MHLLTTIEWIQVSLIGLGFALFVGAPAICLLSAISRSRPLLPKTISSKVVSTPKHQAVPVTAYRPVPVQSVYRPNFGAQQTDKVVRPADLKKTAKMHFGRLLTPAEQLLTAIPRDELPADLPPSPYAPLSPDAWMKRVFILDDDPITTATLALLVANLGHEPVTCNFPEQALSRLLSEPFDALITDYQMPLMNGLELAQKLRNQDCAIPVLMVSGDASEIDPFLSEQLNVRQILAKPIATTELKTALEIVLSIESPSLSAALCRLKATYPQSRESLITGSKFSALKDEAIPIQSPNSEQL